MFLYVHFRLPRVPAQHIGTDMMRWKTLNARLSGFLLE
jgi:hypothetical protein